MVGRSGRSPYTPQFRTTAEISGHQIYVKIGGGQPAGFARTPTVDDDLVELAGWVVTEGWFVPWKDQSGRRPVRERICQHCGERPAAGRRGPPVCGACRSPKVQLQAERRAAQRAAQPPPVPRPRAHYGIGFCQSQTANPKNVARIRELVDRLVAARHRISETQYRARYNDSIISQWHFAGTLGRTVRELLPDKRLTPTFIERLTSEQARLLLDVLVLADGHRSARPPAVHPEGSWAARRRRHAVRDARYSHQPAGPRWGAGCTVPRHDQPPDGRRRQRPPGTVRWRRLVSAPADRHPLRPLQRPDLLDRQHQYRQRVNLRR
jgi:hypothetical protein